MIGRFLSAVYQAKVAFVNEWHSYDVIEAAHRKLEDQVRARQSKIDLAMSKLTATDAHFVSSFLNNLVDDVPEPHQVQRFVDIVSTFDDLEAQLRLLQRAGWARPSITASKPFVAWAKHNGSYAKLAADRKENPDITRKVTA